MKTIKVAAGAALYDVLVGPLDAARDRLLAAPILISEPRLFRLHGARVQALIGGDAPILLPEGEAAKSWDVLHGLLDTLAQRGATRSTLLVALGGGSVGDVAGLAASLFKRGCPILHLPTTLLSQADSAVGGKTAIDAFGEKNAIGSFHQPALVVADPAFLATLDARQMRSGYAEIVKYGLIDDPAFFAWCESHGAQVIGGDGAALDHAIVTAVAAKARLIAGDVEDRGGQRALLNLGHSFAHAIESSAGLGALLHGEAVAIGLVLAFALSERLNLCAPGTVRRIAAHLATVGLATDLAERGIAPAALLPWIMRDKKNGADGLTLILARGIGEAYVARGVDADVLASFLGSLARSS